MAPAVTTIHDATFGASWERLKWDFSECCLPDDQPVDVCRTYLRHMHMCRFEVMRTFHKCITEFALDPTNEPAGFQSHLWRYPVRVDIAIEYLGIAAEEYVTLFNGAWPRPCGRGEKRGDLANPAPLWPWTLYGFAAVENGGVP